jgi:hypothetical protein
VLVRYRAKLVALRSGLKAQVHAVLAKEGVAVPMSDLFGKAGMTLLSDTHLGTCYRMRIDSLLERVGVLNSLCGVSGRAGSLVLLERAL